MSTDNRTSAFNIGGIGIVVAIAALAFRASPVASPGDGRAGSEPNRSARRNAYATPSVAVNRYSRGRRLIAEYLGTDWEHIASIKASSVQRAIPLRIVIATLPDPFDSFMDWSFDANIEALRRAFGTAGYVPHSYWLPERIDSVQIDSGTATGTYSLHDFHPGVFLFRSKAPDSPSLALVYIVPELPSSGLHQMSFQAALRERAAIMQSPNGVFAFSARERSLLSVLGPSFSGSAPSMRAMVDSLPHLIDKCTNATRMVTGSATSFSNLRLLSDTSPVGLSCNAGVGATKSESAPRLRFTSMVNPDEAMDEMLGEVVDGLHVKPYQVAVLSEFGTQYGAQGVAGDANLTTPNPVAGPQAVEATSPSPKRTTSTTSYLTVPFPMNIGSLRAEYDRASDGQSAGVRVPQLGAEVRTRFSLEGGTPPREMPKLTSSLTVPTADVVLSGAMRTLREHGTRVVVVRATDVRDKLMLVREIRRSLHGVVIVLYESNLLLRHPEYSQAMRGTLVLSSYPMLLENQYWSTSTWDVDSSLARLHNLTSFPNEAALGVYNAALTLLDRESDRVEYTSRGATGVQDDRGPPVWLSVIGGDGFYPLRSRIPSPAWRQYLDSVPASPPPRSADAIVHEHEYGRNGVFQSLLLVAPAVALLVLFWIMLIRARRDAIGARCASWDSESASRERQRLFFSLFVLAGSSTYLPLAIAIDSRRAIGSLDAFQGLHSIAMWFVLITLVPAAVISIVRAGYAVFVLIEAPMPRSATGENRLIVLGRSVLPSIRRVRHVVFAEIVASIPRFADQATGETTTPRDPTATTLGRPVLGTHEATRREIPLSSAIGMVVIVVACFSFSIGSLAYSWHLLSFSSTGGAEAAFTLYRALHLTSGVSPLAPLILLGGAFASWTWWQLQQTRRFSEPSEFEDGLRVLADQQPPRAIWCRAYRAIVDARRGLNWYAPGPAIGWLVAILVLGTWFVLRGRIPSLEMIGDVTRSDWPFDVSLWVGILAIVTASSWAIYRLLFTWNGLERFLDIVAGTPMASAFGRLPLDVAKLTDVGFLGFRRDNRSDAMYLDELWTRTIEDAKDTATAIGEEQASEPSALTGESSGAGGSATLTAATALERAPEKATVTKARGPDDLVLAHANERVAELLTVAGFSTPRSSGSVSIALETLHNAWDVARTRPDPFKELPIEEPTLAMRNKRALRTLEEYVAFEILLYTELYLLNLRRLCFYLFASLLALVILGSAYPYEPHGVVSLATLMLLLGTVGSIFFVMTRMSRSSTLSRIAHTEPGKITWDSGFVLNLIILCVLPLLALASSEFPQVRSVLFSWLEPVMRAFGHS